MNRKPVVAIVGRPNVGKSTFVNRLIGNRQSIVDDLPGVTRDRIYGNATYDKFNFYLIDTGGIDIRDDNWNNVITNQVMLAIDESDVIVFVVDGKEGVTSNDEYITELLHKSGKKVVVAINKIDSKLAESNMYEFYSMGFDNYVNISAEHNIGISDLFDKVFEDFDESEEELVDEKPKFCVIGRPNVGKSSLVNALLNEERVIVSDVAGTTRDSIDTVFKYENNEYILIDTAGLRKKGRIYESVEKYSLIRSLKAITRSDVCVIVIDASTGIIEQDTHVGQYIEMYNWAVQYIGSYISLLRSHLAFSFLL